AGRRARRRRATPGPRARGGPLQRRRGAGPGLVPGRAVAGVGRAELLAAQPSDEDRKSTRLNSSHVSISYAVFCLKKKRRTNTNYRRIEATYITHSAKQNRRSILIRYTEKTINKTTELD